LLLRAGICSRRRMGGSRQAQLLASCPATATVRRSSASKFMRRPSVLQRSVPVAGSPQADGGIAAGSASGQLSATATVRRSSASKFMRRPRVLQRSVPVAGYPQADGGIAAGSASGQLSSHCDCTPQLRKQVYASAQRSAASPRGGSRRVIH
jgi:hypothetical protein